MGQILHGSARTTEVVRRAIQNSEESLKVLSKKHGSFYPQMRKTNNSNAYRKEVLRMKPKHHTHLSLSERRKYMFCLAVRFLCRRLRLFWDVITQPSIARFKETPIGMITRLCLGTFT